MSEKEQIDNLALDLDRLIARYCTEYDITFASAIGVLQMKVIQLANHAEDDMELN